MRLTDETRLRRNLRFIYDIHLPWCERNRRKPDERLMGIVCGWQQELRDNNRRGEPVIPIRSENEAWDIVLWRTNPV